MVPTIVIIIIIIITLKQQGGKEEWPHLRYHSLLFVHF
jgi:hypothetical protein